MKKAFLDLDGTLIDSSLRHVEVLKKILEDECICSKYTSDYLTYKADGKSTMSFLKEKYLLTEECARGLSLKWIDQIERHNYLHMDVWYDDVPEFLQYLNNNSYSIYALTARKDKEWIIEFINNSAYRNYFHGIEVVNPTSAREEKVAYVVKTMTPKSILIGDTEIEYETGLETGIDTYILDRGFRSKKFLREKGSNRTFSSLIEVIKELEMRKE